MLDPGTAAREVYEQTLTQHTNTREVMYERSGWNLDRYVRIQA